MSNGDLPRIRVRRTRGVRRNQRWRWSLVVIDAARREHVVCDSGEGYSDRDECVRMALKVCSGSYADAVVDLR
jgi:hypothetical protein